MIKESREENKERRIAKKQARKEAKENASQGKGLTEKHYNMATYHSEPLRRILPLPETRRPG